MADPLIGQSLLDQETSQRIVQVHLILQHLQTRRLAAQTDLKVIQVCPSKGVTAESGQWILDVSKRIQNSDSPQPSGSGVPVPVAAGTETACRRSDPAPGSAGRTPSPSGPGSCSPTAPVLTRAPSEATPSADSTSAEEEGAVGGVAGQISGKV